MKHTLFLSSAAAAAAFLPFAALAQQAAPTQQPQASAAGSQAAVETGTTVYGSDGEPIGTVADANAEAVLLDTGTYRIPVRAAVLAAGDKGPELAMTKADLNAEVEKQIAAQEAALGEALVEGANVTTADSQPLGQIASLTESGVVIASDSGSLTIPKAAFAVSPEGEPVVRATMEQIREAAAQPPATCEPR